MKTFITNIRAAVICNAYERCRWQIKRIWVGAAVKSCRRSKPTATFGHRKSKGVGSSPTGGARKRKTRESVSFLFQLNPPLRVGEILLRNVKSSLRSGEIAAAVGGFNFTFCVSKIFHQRRKPLISPCDSTISLILATSPLLCYNKPKR